MLSTSCIKHASNPKFEASVTSVSVLSKLGAVSVITCYKTAVYVANTLTFFRPADYSIAVFGNELSLR